jgi:hypothetical protein
MPTAPPGLIPPEVLTEMQTAANSQFDLLLNWWPQVGPPSEVGGMQDLASTPTIIPARATDEIEEFYNEQGYQTVPVRKYYVDPGLNIQPGDQIQENGRDDPGLVYPILYVDVQPSPATPVIKSVRIGAA